jgi:hypothetical protein
VLSTVFGFLSREILLLHLNEIFTFVCPKRFVIFLIFNGNRPSVKSMFHGNRTSVTMC